mmetsp:Transcript_3938/g.11670  ORF Transcript_3938/g.11670 Transcript_3938/m.11670 type:complete len:200 (+) Transcript_3938:1747-2346(+)
MATATFACISSRRVRRPSSMPEAKKTRALPQRNFWPGTPSFWSSASTRSLGALPASSALVPRPGTTRKLPQNSSKGMRSGNPVRATRSASSTPDVLSWRVMTASSTRSGFFWSLDLKQRTKCRSHLSSVPTRSVSCAEKVSVTPLNLVDLNFFRSPAAGATSAGSVKSSLSSSLSENCISTTRSCESGSLFFSRKPVDW